MSNGIEQHLSALTDALNRNTEALLAAGGTASAAATTSSTKGASGKTSNKKDDKPKVTQEQMTAALVKLKDKFGMDEAKAVIAEHGGGATKMAEIKPACFQATYDGAVAAFEALGAPKKDEDEDGI